MKVFFIIFGTLLVAFWLYALVDWVFALQCESDPHILWAAPLMGLFALVLRVFAQKIFGFVEKNY